ncbi:MAG: CUB domain-containing protein, partial [Bacteroidales bacterium]|nr:CUB domain-containing protein [Bacteroidales bacterium]
MVKIWKVLFVKGMLLSMVFFMATSLQVFAQSSTGRLNMNTGVTNLSCGDVIDFYDDGGPNQNYTTSSQGSTTLTHTLNAPAGTRIKISFSRIALGGVSNQFNDVTLSFFNSATATGTATTINRNNNANPSSYEFTSTSNVLTLRFYVIKRTNQNSTGIAGAGWVAKIELIGCPDERAQVNLPCDNTTNIGGTYSADEYYYQTYSADPGIFINLDFTSLPNDGANDYIVVYDGGTLNSTVLGTYSGATLPPTLESSGNKLTLLFRSNAQNNGSWGATLTTTSCPTDIVMPPNGETREYTTCSSHLYDDGGENGDYSRGYDGTVILHPEMPGKVLHLEGTYEFRWKRDYITIYDGVGTGGEILWGGGCHGHGHAKTYNSGCPGNGRAYDYYNDNPSACVTFYPRVTSKTGSLTVVFHTENTNEATCDGFDFEISCVTPPTDCYSTGELIYKEDFGGNSPGDPESSSSGLPNGVCDYGWNRNSPCQGSNRQGYYDLRKYGSDCYERFNYIDDHTHPGDITRGYLFQVDASNQTNVFYRKKIEEEFCAGTK